MEAWPGIEPGCKDLQSSASPLRHQAGRVGLRFKHTPRGPASGAPAGCGAPRCFAVKRAAISAGLQPHGRPDPMTPSLSTARTNMVENQVRTNDVTDLDVQDAMRVVPRERLCPPGRAHLAYAETEVEYAPGWFLAEPRVIAKLLQAVYPQVGERALSIAAPYAALLMKRIGLEVTALQAEDAAPAFLTEALGAEGVVVATGRLDPLGACGPYDVIVCEGAVERAPTAWTDALASGGRLGVV